MKRIMVSLISVIMCCAFVLPVCADTYTSNFMISRLQFSSVRGYRKDGTNNPVVNIQEDMTKMGPNFYEFTTDKLVLHEESLTEYDIVAGFQIWGSFDKLDGVEPDSYVSFNFSLRVTENRPINFDDTLNQYVRLTLPDINTEVRNYIFTKMNDYQYQISFIAPLSGIDYNYINSTYFRFYLPIKWLYDASTESDDFFIQIMFDELSITYDSIPLKSSDVQLIINDLDSIDTTVSAIKDQLDNMPTDVANALRDLELGSVETAVIPQDELDELAGIEDELYAFSDSKMEYIGQSINQLGNTLNSHIGKVDTGHSLFFTRVFEIEFIRDMVYISLGFGLVAFILRLGRKIQ